jgi:hypothetical protein
MAPFCSQIFDAIDTDIDNRRSLLHKILFDKLGDADSSHNNIRTPTNLS